MLYKVQHGILGFVINPAVIKYGPLASEIHA